MTDPRIRSNRPRPEGVALACPPKGGESRIGKPRWGVVVESGSVESLALLAVPRFLLANVLPHQAFVPANRTHPVTRCPKVKSSHPSFSQQLSVNPHSTLTFQKTNRVRNAVLRRNLQAQADVV